ncbi:MAG: phosphoribosylaminoimidazolecarboxamide formyltransferase [Proteobacteria bacterium]|jgi:phosphoribosylaminoimidazolecarboxamide formyltransferase/IMP cyclohydrolase|nr:phosphoribosylaminoimidazolecarboxamide formyltransferase [Pseudomonadota bacterium]MDA1300466.1 phosphoribosylaminoimidazolecarboxamide formyltransferase [Pseudomonadota bacterium]
MKQPLKYGVNPHQGRAFISADTDALSILNGSPGYINFLDALTAWQLVMELSRSTGKAAAASFKHVSPAGAAIAKPLTDPFRQAQFLTVKDLSPVATAYARARGGDRMCSFGDVLAVSETVDESLARLLRSEVSDLIIAPGYEPRALEILQAKKGGAFAVLQMDPAYEAPELETRELFGFRFEQERNSTPISADLFDGAPDDVVETMLVATTALKYAQSNSVCVAYDGQVIGMGAGQQSRIHCTRLACDKADKWMLQYHPRVQELAFKPGLKKPEKANVVDQFLLSSELSDSERQDLADNLMSVPEPITLQEKLDWVKGFDGLCLSSDAYIPFRDNIDRAARSHVRYIAHPGGSVADEVVRQACRQYGIGLLETGLRCFLH